MVVNRRPTIGVSHIKLQVGSSSSTVVLVMVVVQGTLSMERGSTRVYKIRVVIKSGPVGERGRVLMTTAHTVTVIIVCRRRFVPARLATIGPISVFVDPMLGRLRWRVMVAIIQAVIRPGRRNMLLMRMMFHRPCIAR